MSPNAPAVDIGAAPSLDTPLTPEGDTKQPAEDHVEKDSNLVDWDGPDDPEHPQNLTRLRKWGITFSLASMTMWITFSSSVLSVATHPISEEYNVSTKVMPLATTLVIFGFALGPLCWAPLSELYGRRLPTFLGYGVFAIFQVPVAVAPNLQTIMVCRFFVGVFGSSALSVGPGVMADIWDPVDRGIATPFFFAANLLGPILGPIIGGFITESQLGWRWTAWLTLITSIFFGVLALLIVPETYSPVLLQQRASRLRRATQNQSLYSFLDQHRPTLAEFGYKYLARPFMMFLLEPILICFTVYLSLIYGILYLFLEAYPVAFAEERHWTNKGIAGLPFLGILVGMVLGIGIIIYNTRTRFARHLAEQGQVAPEERLVEMMLTSITMPIGLFWFGWAAHTHWMVQTIAGVPLGIGLFVLFMQGMNYLIDVYLTLSNSAIAANTLARSFLGGSFPLFATAMYHNLGVDWASTILGFISVAMVPIPFAFYIFGARIRAMSRYTVKAGNGIGPPIP